MLNWYFAGVVIAFFLTILLIGKKHKTDADRILALWMFLTGIHIAFYYLLRSGLQYEHPFSYSLGLQIPFPLLHPPLLYLYVASLTNQQTHKKQRWLHSLPILLAYLMFIDFHLLPVNEKIAVFEQEGAPYAFRVFILFIAFIVSGVFYLLRSAWLLYRHRRNIEQVFSFAEKINLMWLRYLIAGLAVIWCIVTFWGNDDAIYGASTFYVLLIGYFGIHQAGIFTPTQALTQTSSKTSVKYKKSGLDEADIQSIQAKLKSAMLTQKPYTDPELTLGALADLLKVHPNELSQVINSAEGCTFYDYINGQRVEAFLKAATDPKNDHLTLLGIAYDCGFNSKASFNRNFKKSTGLTPTEYLKFESSEQG